MLAELRVENLGIIEELLVPMAAGMTVITGETGAGKTLLVDALELLCGGRADPGAVRDGATEARVEARFVVDDDEVVLARVIPTVGRSRGYVNGRLATASELVEKGRELVDLHGQHSHQSLLAPAEQRALLDRAAGEAAFRARQDLQKARAEIRRVDDELAGLGGDERARAREVDLLRYQVAEIEAATVIGPDEDEELREAEAVLADAEAHREALTAAHAALEGAAEDAVGGAYGALAARVPFAALADRLHGLQGEIAELAHDVRMTLETVVADPERLAAVQARRATLQELTRKYGPTLADVVAYRAEAGARLAELEQHDARAAAPPGRADCVRRGRQRAPRRNCRRNVGPPRRRWPRRSPSGFGNSRCPPPRSRFVSRRARWGRKGLMRSPSGSRPTPAKPRARWRGPRPAASSHVRCSRSESCCRRRRRPWCSTRSTLESVAKPEPRWVEHWPRWEGITRCCA